MPSNKESDNMSKKKKIALIVSIVLALTATLGMGLAFSSLNKKDSIEPTKEDLKPINYNAVKIANASEIINFGSCTSKKEDENCYLIVNEAMITFKNSKIEKIDGDTTNVNESIDTGKNSAILATYGTYAKVLDTTIHTSADGANALFVNGTDAEGEINDSLIETLKTNSSGLVATNKGYIKGDHTTITTKVRYSPAIRTLEENSEIELTNTTLETNGSASPIIDAHGKIYLTTSTGTANGSRIATLNNNANVVINNSSMIVSGGSDDEFGPSAILINSKGKNDNCVFQSINSSLNINKNLLYYNLATFIVINNSKAEIDLENTALNFGSNKFLKATDSEITFNLKNQVIHGELELDNSNLQMNLSAQSSYTGTINNNNVSIYLSKDSELNLTGDLHLKALKNDDETNSNLSLNGYHIYVNNELVI